MRTYPAFKDLISIVEQVLRCNCRSNIIASCFNKISHICRGNVFRNNPEIGYIMKQRLQDSFQKFGFPIKDIHLLRGDFTVDKQRHTELSHLFKSGVNLVLYSSHLNQSLWLPRPDRI